MRKDAAITRVDGTRGIGIPSLKIVLIAGYFAWTAVLFIGKMSDDYEARDTSRLLTLAYFALFLALFRALHWLVGRWGARDGIRFVLLGLASAFIVEAMFMISQPINEGLLIGASTSPGRAIGNTLADWAIVTPIYLLFYILLWRLLTKYDYNLWSVFVFTAIASFIGEAHVNLLFNPLLAVVAGPYFFMVYQCRDMPAYLLMRDRIEQYPRIHSRFQYVLMMALAAVFWGFVLVASL